jgi:hypothetical protein
VRPFRPDSRSATWMLGRAALSDPEQAPQIRPEFLQGQSPPQLGFPSNLGDSGLESFTVPANTTDIMAKGSPSSQAQPEQGRREPDTAHKARVSDNPFWEIQRGSSGILMCLVVDSVSEVLSCGT